MSVGQMWVKPGEGTCANAEYVLKVDESMEWSAVSKAVLRSRRMRNSQQGEV